MAKIAEDIRTKAEELVNDEQGHAAAWGGGGILTIVLVVLLLAWLF